MNVLDRFRRRDTDNTSQAHPWLPVGDDDMAPDERAVFEIAINSAVHGGETIVVQDEDGVTVNGNRCPSIEEAAKAARGETS